MEIAGLAFGVVGAVDVCLKHGNALMKTCQAVRNADAQLSEASLKIEAYWTRIYGQLSVLRSMDASLDDHYRQINLRVLDTLMSKLRAADSKLSRISETQTDHASTARTPIEAKKFKFALYKSGLTEAIDELVAWQGIFDPTWFLIMTMATPDVDKQLEVTARESIDGLSEGGSSAISAAQQIRRGLKTAKKTMESGTRSTIFLPPNGLRLETSENIPFCPATTALRVDQRRVLLDPIVPRYNATSAMKDSRSLAERLKRADPFTFGLLECKGLYKEESNGRDSMNSRSTADRISRLAFVFSLPSLCKAPQTVRGRLVGGLDSTYDSLTERIDLAKQLVNAVNYTHVYNFVHKNIRPETILILSTRDKSGTGQMKETAVLVGFEAFRSAEGNTDRSGDDKWENNIYRHPSRQGLDPQVDYDMRHDIYSVGVCLLEIGLWRSFVTYEPDGSTQVTIPGLNTSRRDQKEVSKDSNQLKSHLVELARGTLKRRVGTRYGQVVETCLTCLDETNADFGNAQDFEDEDGIAVGARYIEKVVTKLAEIVV